MSVDPEHAARPVHGSKPSEGPERDRVVATENERKRTASCRLRNTAGYELARVVDLRQEAGALIAERCRLGDSRLHIAFVPNLVAQALEPLLETGIADRRRAHVDTATALPEVERSPDDRDLALPFRNHDAKRYAILDIAVAKDCWAEWLAERRYGGDTEQRRRGMEQLTKWRDSVLENARLSEGETLLDVGCGEGLIGFGALALGAGTVIFSDISQDLLDFCHEAATALDLLDRCRFVQASADNLEAIGSGSVDVVTTRSVLIYVAEKQSAFGEFARVLRSGGRISLFEPINRFAKRAADTWDGYDLSPVPDITKKIREVYDAIQPPDTDPMLNFDERDLLDLADRAGFSPIHLHLDAEITPSEPWRWESFLSCAGNPRIPTLAEAMSQGLTSHETERLTAHLRPLVEEGRGTWRMAAAYLYATRP
jgi:ubiquinone/menaquinone biosynthesis C-methylase UbiE